MYREEIANGERQIAACVEPLGFKPPEFVYVESEGPIGYFPKPTRFIYHALAAKRNVIKNPRSLITLIGRITK